MEEKNNSGLVVALVIFIIISIGLGCYIGYDKLLNNKTNNTETSNTQSSEKNKNEENTDSYQVLELSPIGGTAVMYNGEVYVNIYDSSANIDDIYGEGKFQTMISARSNYKEYSFGNLVVNTKLVNDGAENKWLKLNVSGVKSIHNNEYGQAVSNTNVKYGILILNSDGSVSYIGFSDLINGIANVTTLDATDVSNVVTETNMGYVTYLVKADGTKTDVNTLIK